ncbi:hypothetical protein PRI8871_03355 [Pseudoprimorskyibacter insulae]|uniref:Uncharacterized protein n=1 Tax=Pseudoprimorskyibacter insulae TaxID=1695997 RepID=A0A2R8AZS9_9RHOB|nr:hypothetical protein PRI8871_03355 [Pseudoprimorskyibacter insulae]
MSRSTANETTSGTADFTLSIGSALTEIDLWRSTCNPRIL